MHKERIQHLKDVIFTRETMKTKEHGIMISQAEAKEFIRLVEADQHVKTNEEIQAATDRLMKSWEHLDQGDQQVLAIQFHTLISVI